MVDKIICPLSMCSDNIKRCHPGCKMLDDKGNCMIVTYVEKALKEPKKKEEPTQK